MSAEKSRCPKCNGEMVQGFSFESQGPRRIVSQWVEGVPEKTILHGTNAPKEKQIPIGMFRCTACGFLESYARPEFAAT
jgi:hypothetical protein